MFYFALATAIGIPLVFFLFMFWNAYKTNKLLEFFTLSAAGAVFFAFTISVFYLAEHI